jgi:hypothetical protein
MVGEPTLTCIYLYNSTTIVSLALAPLKMSLETVAKVRAFSYRRSRLKATNLLVRVLYPLLSFSHRRMIGGSPVQRIGLVSYLQ